MLIFAIFLGAIFGIVYADVVRIVGGVDTEIHLHPYQLSFQTDTGRHFCGAVLISSFWALTAAHCVFDRTLDEIQSLRIRAGSALYSKGGQLVGVQRAIIHPRYSPETLNNDIALVKFAEAVTDESAEPAVLPEQGSNILDGVELAVTGWGVTDYGNLDIPTRLQEVRVPSVNRRICSELYQPSSLVVTNNMFCLGFLEIDGKDSCNGDSGGPASRNGKVLGLVSWGINCADKRYPGVYTQISRYRNWIRQTARV